MKIYTQKIFNELIQPLKAAINGTLTGHNTTDSPRALDSSAFHNRPFLLTLLLGKDYMRDHTEFTNIHNSTIKLLKYQQIREAIVLKLTRSKARLEFVISTPRIEALFSLSPTTISHQVCLLIKVRT